MILPILTVRKASFSFCALCLACFLMSCNGPMPYTFARIDADKLRVIGVVIGPRPEVSPGDTVTATAYFGGNEVVSISDVKLAHRAVGGMDGVAFTDIYPIDLLAQPVGLPDSAKISFVIKPGVFMGRQPYDSMSQSVVDSVSRLFMLPTDSVKAIISSLPDSQKIVFGRTVEKMVLPAVLVFTAHSANGTALGVVAQFTIKYHPGLPGLTPANNNPDISWVGICTVPDRYAIGFNFFDASSQGKFTMTYLYNRNNPALSDSVIDIDTGNAYFLVVDNGIRTRTDSAGGMVSDSAMDAVVDAFGTRTVETYNYKWFYQNVNNVSDHDDTLMQINDDGSPCIEMKPPGMVSMNALRVWVATYDQMQNQYLRPVGMCVRPVRGIFRFSPAYIREKEGK
jgi:hypothetical protein